MKSEAAGRPLKLVFLAAVDYANCLSGRTRRLAEALARQGHRVHFVELPTLGAAARRLLRAAPGCAGVRVVRLPPLPHAVRRRSALLTRCWGRHAAGGLLRAIPSLGEAVLVCSTPWWAFLLRDLPRRLLLYDCIDHVRVHAGPRADRLPLFEEWDVDLLNLSDVVTTVSDALHHSLARRLPPGRRLALVPNGVSRSWLAETARPVSRDLLGGAPGCPVVGFLGAVYEWVDLSLLHQAARGMPQLQFVLVGPQRPSAELGRLRGLPNVRCFGAVAHADVPRWISAFDVCLVPFKHDVVSEAADPIKLYEYSALGKPVVAAGIRPPAGMPDLRLADDAPSFQAAIRQALATDGPSLQAERRRFAAGHTWERRALDLAALTRA